MLTAAIPMAVTGAAAASGEGNTSPASGAAAGLMVAQAQAQVGGLQAPAGGQLIERQSAEQDLVWLLAGIMDMERSKKLAITRSQATSIWPVFKSLIDEGLIRLEVDPAQFRAGNSSGQQGQQGAPQGKIQIQVGPGQGQVIAGRDDPRLQQALKEREARNERLRQAIDEIEKVLSADQIAYVDNFDFEPTEYGLGVRLGGVLPGTERNQGQMTAVKAQDIGKLMEVAKENAQKLADFYKGFQSFLQKKAGVKP